MNTTDYQWRKSQHSDATRECVEAGNGKGVVAVRDSKDPDGPELGFTPETWRTFVGRIKTQ